MPTLGPFRGLGYALDRYAASAAPGTRIADLTGVVCPPYDVITPADRDELLGRSERNAVRLELSTEPDPHAAAASTLATWRADGTLERRSYPTTYRYRYARAAVPAEPVRGVVARLLLEPYGNGVLAHEHTLAAPKADRLALLHATRMQLSPILVIGFDASPDYEELIERPWTDGWQARDDDGLVHSVTAVDGDDPWLERLSRGPLYVADGHHRYETALAYQAAVRADPAVADAHPGSLAADWVMAVIVNAEREQLEIQATHRLIRDAHGDALRSLVREPGPLWQAVPVDPASVGARLAELRDADQPVFGLVLPGDEAFLLLVDAGAADRRMRREPMSPTARRLDLTILHTAILGDRLRIDPDSIAAGGALAYTRSEADAIRAVASGDAKAAILVRPTRLEQLAAVAGAGEVMPQKSTYFYPKLLTGLVFYPLEDE